MSITTEAKVGFLVVAAAVGLGWLAVESGTVGNTLGTQFRVLESEFSSVDGVNIGSKVKMAGVQVGEVIDIELTPNGSAIIRLNVRDEVPLAANVQAQISSSGLIGEKFIGLVTEFGAQGELAESVVRIPSAGNVSPDDIANNFAKVSDDLQEITTALRMSLGGPDNAQRLSNIVTSFEGFSSRLDYLLNEELGDQKLADIVNNLAQFSETLNSEGVNGEMLANISKTAENLAKITDRIEQGEGTLGQLISGEADTDMLADFRAAANEIRAVAEKINGGEGSLGRLINDETTIAKVEGALDSISGFANRVEQIQTEVAFEGYTLPAEGVGKGRFQLTLAPRPSRYYVLGVTGDGFAGAEDRFNDSGDANPSFANEQFGDALKFTVQFGHVFENVIWNQDMGFRIGVKDSTFGIGADFNNLTVPVWGKNMRFSADLYDFAAEYQGRSAAENPHLDLTARVDLIDNIVYGQFGYDNVFNEKYGSPFIGLGMRFKDDDLKYLVGQAL